MNSIRERLLELYLEELRKRERLTGTDRITLYNEFRGVLEQEEGTGDDRLKTRSEAESCRNPEEDLFSMRGIPAARVRSYCHPETPEVYREPSYSHNR
jgi:hypothetical protein